MKQSRFTEEQIVSILEEAQRGEQTVEEVCRKHGVHKQTYYGWRKRFGGMDASDVQRLRSLEQENARLKKALAEAVLDIQILKEVNAKKW
ncbi:MAG: transposase [Bryobacterales bacterium]|mgnify:FL=1|nr:transposase [Bryobacterales bacterium]MEB2364356.1 transposase [Bryobacterales bacterium]